MIRTLLPFLFLSMLFLNQAQAQRTDSESVNWMLPGCRVAFNGEVESNPYRAGMCVGTIEGIIYKSQDLCIPTGVNVRQAFAVVMRYIDQRPERWHQSFKAIANEALVTVWPCR
jgi:hypothetical protein